MTFEEDISMACSKVFVQKVAIDVKKVVEAC
jgi:hypothetical protein